MSDDTNGESTGQWSNEGSFDSQAPPVTSSYKILGRFSADSGVGVLGQNDAHSGIPIGVQGAVPNADAGYGLATPDDARIGGTLEPGTVQQGGDTATRTVTTVESDSDVRQLVQEASPGDDVWAVGDFTTTSPIELDKRIYLHIVGDITAESDIFTIGHNSTTRGGLIQVLGNITGQGPTDGNTAFSFKDESYWDVRFRRIDKIQRGFHFHSDASNVAPVDNTVHGNRIGGVDKAVHFEAVEAVVQGNKFYGIAFFETKETVVADAGPYFYSKPTLNSFYGCTFHGTTWDKNDSEITENDPNGVIKSEGNLYDLSFLSADIDSTKVSLFDGTYIRELNRRDVVWPAEATFYLSNGTPVIRLKDPGNVDMLGNVLFNAGSLKSSSVIWGDAANNKLASSSHGAIELGDSTASTALPFLDFHHGVGSFEDYNVRLQNLGDELIAWMVGAGPKIEFDFGNDRVATWSLTFDDGSPITFEDGAVLDPGDLSTVSGTVDGETRTDDGTNTSTGRPEVATWDGSSSVWFTMGGDTV